MKYMQLSGTLLTLIISSYSYSAGFTFFYCSEVPVPLFSCQSEHKMTTGNTAPMWIKCSVALASDRLFEAPDQCDSNTFVFPDFPLVKGFGYAKDYCRQENKGEGVFVTGNNEVGANNQAEHTFYLVTKRPLSKLVVPSVNSALLIMDVDVDFDSAQPTPTKQPVLSQQSSLSGVEGGTMEPYVPGYSINAMHC